MPGLGGDFTHTFEIATLDSIGNLLSIEVLTAKQTESLLATVSGARYCSLVGRELWLVYIAYMKHYASFTRSTPFDILRKNIGEEFLAELQRSKDAGAIQEFYEEFCDAGAQQGEDTSRLRCAGI